MIFMAEEVPRRLKRFYRESGVRQEGEKVTGSERRGKAEQEQDYSDFDDGSGKKIPSMEYEDLNAQEKVPDEKNSAEIEKLEQKGLEEKIALVEIEKFKQEKKRLPTKEEFDQIAENIFTQLKASDVDALYPELMKAQGTPGRAQRRAAAIGAAPAQGLEKTQNSIPAEDAAPTQAQGRLGRLRGRDLRNAAKQKAKEGNLGAPPTLSQETSEANIKDLLGEETPIKKEELEGEFDLDLDEKGAGVEGAGEEKKAEEENLEDLDLKGLEGGEICPACKSETEKVYYCSACGTPFCGKCGKKSENNYVCQKCGAKVKA